MQLESNYPILSNTKYLLRELWRFNPGSVLISFAGIPIKVSVALTAIYVPKIVLDAIQNAVSPLHFVATAGIVTLVLAVTSLADLFARNTMEHCANSFVLIYLNTKWVEKAADMDYDAFTSDTGKQRAEKARISLDGTSRWGVGSYFPRLVAFLVNVLGFIVYSAILATLHPLIVLLLALCYAISLIATLRAEKEKLLLKDDVARAKRKLNYIAHRTRGLQIGKDIRLYSMAGWLREMAEYASQEKRVLDQKIADRKFILMLINGVLVFLRDGAAYAFLVYRMLQASMTIGEFILYFAAISGLGEWLAQITTNIGNFVEANNYVSDFRSFVDIPDRMNRKAQAVPPGPDAAVAIELQNVSFAYGTASGIVLEGVNLQIRAGEKLAIVGENGAGKTTLIKLMCSLVRATEGRILINDVDMHQFARDDYYGIFSVVFQDSDLLPVSIAKNIALGVDAEEDRDDDACKTVETRKSVEAGDVSKVEDTGDIDGTQKLRQKRLEECLARAGLLRKVQSLPQGLDTPLVKQISESGTELSGGEKQKLLLARALYKRAPVIILDEPTAALDPIAEQEIYLQYSTLTQGKTSIFISHRLSSTRFCDRIIFLSAGRIAEVGTHDELMALQGKYATMFQVQSHYYQEDAEVRRL